MELQMAEVLGTVAWVVLVVIIMKAMNLLIKAETAGLVLMGVPINQELFAVLNPRVLEELQVRGMNHQKQAVSRSRLALLYQIATFYQSSQ